MYVSAETFLEIRDGDICVCLVAVCGSWKDFYLRQKKASFFLSVFLVIAPGDNFLFWGVSTPIILFCPHA